MLFAFVPAALVESFVLPVKFAVAVALVLLELALVLFAVRPHQVPLTLHLVGVPLTCVSFSIAPLVSSEAVNLVVQKCTIENGTVSESEGAFAFFAALDEVSFILCAVGPDLLAPTVLFVVLPTALVGCTVAVCVDSLPVSLVFNPHAFVDISICVKKLPVTIGLVVLPLTNVFASIWPFLKAFTVSLAHQPLSLVNCTVRYLNRWESRFLHSI